MAAKSKGWPLCKCGCGLPTGRYFNNGRFKNYLNYIPEHLPKVIIDGQKRCTKCKTWKSTSDFYGARRKSGLMGECILCNKKRAKETKDRLHGGSTAYSRKIRYGITVEDVNSMIASQNGVCPICLKREPTCVDHCHTTNRIRGMLCSRCNSAIGIVGELDGAKRMIEYLSR